MAIPLCTAVSCVWPVPVEEWPPRIDLPPKITQVQPVPYLGPVPLSLQCPSGAKPFYTFVAAVEDPDPGDTIYWRTFVDYFRNNNYTTLVSDPHTIPPVPGSPGPSLISFPIYTNDVSFSPTPGTTTDPHFVELLIADRPFDDAAAPLDRVVKDGGSSDSVIWTIGFAPNGNSICSTNSGG